MGKGKWGKDEALLKAIQDGDNYAFKKLFFKYYTPLCDFAYTFMECRSQSEGVVQEVFTHFWEVRKKVDPRGNIRAYLFKSVKHKSLDHLKKDKTEQKYISDFFLEKTMVSYQRDVSTGKSEFISDVRKAIDNLPKRTKQVYWLSRKEGLTYREIAKVMGISIKTVESQMARALDSLRSQLSKYLTTLLLFMTL